MLTEGVWAVKIKTIMRVLVVEKKDQMALAAIVQAVSEAVLMAISEKETTKEACDALKEMHVGEDRVKKAHVQTLKREFKRIYMGDSETIIEFALKLTTMVNEMRALGTKVEESAVVEISYAPSPTNSYPLSTPLSNGVMYRRCR